MGAVETFHILLDLIQLRAQEPLPETADELCAVDGTQHDRVAAPPADLNF
jgi:hypothetical protein